ncbi:MAG: glycosyltransferase family 4 protein [Chloroflexaceae bacterium]|nr:glycosyltransferase family 4 protein [Chloroflexaceae bacterium]
MKILLLHDYGTATGGAELQMLFLRQNLRDRGHQVRLFSSCATSVPGSKLLSDDQCFGTTSPLQVISQVVNFSAYWQLRQVLQTFRPDIVHIRMFLWQLSPLILPLLRNVPCIYQTAIYKVICPLGTKILPNNSHCQEQVGPACWQQGCLTLQSWAFLMVQHQLWQRWRGAIDLITALSQAMRVKLEREGIGPVEVVYNGVPERSLRPPLADPPTIAYAGRLVPEKGVQVLLNALKFVKAQIPSVRLLVAGQGTQQAELQALSAQLGLTDNVFWLGHLSRAELEQKFEAAWVQVVPSLWEEPFGNVTTEAMMRGTAAIASAVGAQPEIIRDGQTGFLVPPNDAEALGAASVKILQNRSLAEQLGRAGRDRALTHFSESACTERFLEIYRRLLTFRQFPQTSALELGDGVR